MALITITSKSQFDDLIKSTRYVALQTTASWCGPCKAISPIFVKHADTLAVENTYAFAKFDIDDDAQLTAELGVRSVPTFLFFENGEKADVSVTGANPPALKKAVEDIAEKTKATTA